jgi:hypothetical protein
MASSKYYAYYIRGRQLAVVQHDYTLGSGQTLSQPGLNSVGARGDVLWKSPTEAVTDGIEIEYAYSPRYRINDIEDKSTALTGYDESSGLLKFTGSGLSTDAAITHIVIKGSQKWNGLHKINTLNANYWIVETKYNGAAVTESGITAYTDIDALSDESDTIDLPEYLTKALVYYVKAKIAEDRGELEQKEYNMREFKRLLERNESAKVWGARRIGTDETAIK